MQDQISAASLEDALADPWRQAQEIAQRWQTPACRVVLALGAQSWCETCRILYPQFVHYAHSAQAGAEAGALMLWLWLDLDEHQEFIGDLIPDDLPWLFLYQGRELLWQGAWRSLGAPGPQALLHFVQSGVTPPGAVAHDDGGLAARLLRPDWA